MTAPVMADFVGQHRFEFHLGQLGDQRVVEYDFPESPKAYEVRVGVGRASTAIGHLNGLGGESGAFSQLQEAIPQRTFWQRGKFIEQG